MQDVLDQYEKPYDATEPVICMDEQPYQLLDDVRPSEPAAPGKAAKEDYEYRRCGTCSVFVAVEPKGGKRFVQARRHRKRANFARFVRDLLRRYPKARRIHLVLDNLNTHNAKSLTETTRLGCDRYATESLGHRGRTRRRRQFLRRKLASQTSECPIVLRYSLELGSTMRLVNARHGESGAPP